MGKIINFPKMKIGEILEIEFKNQIFSCKVLAHVEGDIYKIKALNGKYKGQVSLLEITRWDEDNEQ